MLSASEIKKRKDLKVLHLSVPEWQEEGDVAPVVGVRMLRGNEAEALEALTRAGKDGKEDPALLGKICAFILCDEAGNRIFDDKDGPELAGKALGALKRIAEAALEHNGLTQKAQDALGNSSTSNRRS